MGRTHGPVRSRAFAPGHITGFFVPELSARDPRARGSLGAGFVLDRGVLATARWDPEGPTRLRVRAVPSVPLPISREVASRLRAGVPGDLEVDLQHALPIGQGLGMSAAGAVATGLAVGQLLGVPAQKIWETAHLVELYLGGGLGGVASLRAGGLELRRRAGVPPWGECRHQGWNRELLLLRTGPPVPSPPLLRSPPFLARVRRAGNRSLARYLRRPSPGAFLRETERFTDALGLAPPDLAESIREIRSPSVAAAQAMFGALLYAVPKRPGGRGEIERVAARWRTGDLLPVAVGRRGAGTLGSPRESGTSDRGR
jgi:pantoate kinase